MPGSPFTFLFNLVGLAMRDRNGMQGTVISEVMDMPGESNMMICEDTDKLQIFYQHLPLKISVS